MDTTKAVTHVSLCAGYGGIDLGLKRAIPSLRTIAFSEIEAFACANLVSKMEAGQLDPAPIWTNLKTFPWSSFRGKVGVLSGGYPCQPFSTAGKRLGADDPRHLWPFITDGIAAMRPAICFFENVEGHISLGLEQVLRDLQGLGYRCTFGVFSASEVGAPHQRKRLFILADSADERQEWSSIAGSCSASSAVEGCGNRFWPSRPGQPQFAWEPPRVVADAQRVRRSETRGNTGGVGKTECAEEGSKSQFGYASSTINGGSSVMGHSAQLLRNGGDDNAGSGERLETLSQSGNAGGQTSVGDASITRTNAFASSSASRDSVSKPSIWQTEPTLGGNADGPAGRLDYAQLCVAGDSRVDELRLLGNGVVPATAERAFNVLASRLFS